MKISTKLFNTTYNLFLPLLCTFELTKHCNLSCCHCYIPPHQRHSSKEKELSTLTIKRILKQLADAGVLYLVFTGGEVFLRPDIMELCRYARKTCHFELRVFSNGILPTAQHINKLKLFGISSFDVSLYGTKNTHDTVTGVKGSFKRLMSTIAHCRKQQIPVTIKTPCLTLNEHDIPWLRRFAKNRGIRIQIDPLITPRNDGDRSPLIYRLSLRSMRRFLKENKDIIEHETLYDLKENILPAESDASFACSAGRNSCAIDAEGNLLPCLQVPLVLGNLKKKTFESLWNKNSSLKRYRTITSRNVNECISCAWSDSCQRCPGLSLIESGGLSSPVPILCSIAKARKS